MIYLIPFIFIIIWRIIVSIYKPIEITKFSDMKKWDLLITNDKVLYNKFNIWWKIIDKKYPYIYTTIKDDSEVYKKLHFSEISYASRIEWICKLWKNFISLWLWVLFFMVISNIIWFLFNY